MKQDVAYVKYLGDRARRLYVRVDESCEKYSYASLRSVVADEMQKASLRTRYHLGGPPNERPAEIYASEVVGFLAKVARLSGTVLLYCIRQLGEDFEGFHVVDCLRPGNARDRPPLSLPTRNLAAVRKVVFPVHLDRCHWGVVFVIVNKPSEMIVTLYEPLVDRAYQESLFKVWEGFIKPMLERWNERDCARTLNMSMRWSVSPKQPDGTSCGVHCVAKVFESASGMINTGELATELGGTALRQLRMFMLWRLVCQSIHVDVPDRDEEEARQTLLAFAASTTAPKLLAFAASTTAPKQQ